jgi:acrylyl-CoA reductase (NADPH)
MASSMTTPDDTTFRALVTRETEPGRFESRLEERRLGDLPPGEVTIDVRYSSINYKDVLVASGHRGITKRYPHTPGIDAAGVVVASSDANVPIGREAVVLGYDLGMNTPGGYGERIRVPSRWVLSKPDALTLREAMQHGTAGLTASLSVRALLEGGLRPEAGEVVVTGASGGVGAIAVAMLAKLGFRVVAVARRPEATEPLLALGAAGVVTPSEVMASGGKPMVKERWAGGVDTVGGELLFEIVKSLRYGAAVTACGMAAGPSFAGNVFPFILRGARLIGIDSVELEHDRKQAALDALGTTLRIDGLDRIAPEIALDALPSALESRSLGTNPRFGRTLVRLS